MEIGDKIALRGQDSEFVYEVTDRFDTWPDDISALDETSEPTLTLITCTPVPKPTHRLVVIAEFWRKEGFQMPTMEIKQDKWNDFLSGFSAHNQTRPVVVEIESAELGPQRVIDGKPLLAVEPDLDDENEPMITVVAGDPQGAEPSALTHQVMNPRAIWVKADDEGEPQVLDIETDDGRTIVQFV